jgi:hypothetical protein
MTETSVEEMVAAIAAMDLQSLRLAWGQRYGAPPSLRSVSIMRMLLAWRIQSEAWGTLDDDTRRLLARTSAPHPEGHHLGIGARLTRQWKGRQVEVIVEEQGFRWDGRLYPSLSGAATAIAGSRWNGPRFFGLRDAGRT